MPGPSRLAITNVVATRLVGVNNAIGYYGRIGRALPGQVLVSAGGTIPDDPPAKDPENGDLEVVPYFVLYPGGGTDGPDTDLGDDPTGVTIPLPITAVAGDIEDLLALVDRILARLAGWRPVLDGVACDRIRFPLGFTPGSALLVDEAEQPPRQYVRLPLQLTATT